MSIVQAEAIAYVVVAAAISAFVGYRLAVADGVEPNRAWGWAGLAGAAAIVDGGILGKALELDQGAPSPERMGAVGLEMLCAVGVAVVGYALAVPGCTRGRRWCATATTFSLALAVLAALLGFLG